MSIHTQPVHSRRTMLALGGAGVASLTLAGCSSGPGTGPDTGPGGSGGDGALPTYTRREVISPDLAGDNPSVADGFLNYPEPTQTVEGTPGDGSTVTVSTMTFAPPPTPVKNNQRWQAINEALGVDVDFQLVPQSEYSTKFTTMMTSSDLPDLMLIAGGPRVRQFVAASCADLTEFIGGDAVADYPNLANLPESAWRSMGLVQGKVMGIPIPRMIQPYVNQVNRDLLDAVGASDDWQAQDFLDAMAQVRSGPVHGFGAAGYLGVPYFASALGAPNEWAVKDGQFVSAYTTDEYRAGLEMARQGFADGLYHPDTASVSLTDLWNIFVAGNMAACYGSFGTFANGKRAEQVNGRFHTDVALPFGSDNTGWAQPGMFAWVAFKKADPERIRMLLRICDYLAAPFGSTEFELLKYGVEGTHFDRQADGPVPTQLGNDEPAASLPFDFIANGPEVIRIPGEPESVQRAFEVQNVMIPQAITNPSEGLFSATFDKSGSSLHQKLSDAVVATVSGRATLEAFDTAVQEFLEGGGKAIADEYSAEAAG